MLLLTKEQNGTDGTDSLIPHQQNHIYQLSLSGFGQKNYPLC